MFDIIIKQIQDLLQNEIHPKMRRCYELKEKSADVEVKRKLDDKYMVLDAYLNRAAICLDILMGHAFVIKDENTNMTVILPESPQHARYIMEAEKLGARAVSHEG